MTRTQESTIRALQRMVAAQGAPTVREAAERLGVPRQALYKMLPKLAPHVGVNRGRIVVRSRLAPAPELPEVGLQEMLCRDCFEAKPMPGPGLVYYRKTRGRLSLVLHAHAWFWARHGRKPTMAEVAKCVGQGRHPGTLIVRRHLEGHDSHRSTAHVLTMRLVRMGKLDAKRRPVGYQLGQCEQCLTPLT